MIQFLKNAVFLWSLLSSIVAGTAYYLTLHEAFIEAHALAIAVLCLMLTSSLLTYYTFSTRVKEAELKFYDGIRQLQIAQLKSDVDRYFKDHKDSKALSEDEAQYLYMLEERRQEYGVNSFTQRKIQNLLQKDIY